MRIECDDSATDSAHTDQEGIGHPRMDSFFKGGVRPVEGGSS